jgi:O-antigen/teichoic acid export membrane protein
MALSIKNLKTSFGRHFTEVVWVVIGNLSAAVGTLAATRILTSYLGIEEFGLYSLASTLSLFLCQSFFNPPFIAIIRQWSTYEESQRQAVFIKAICQLTIKLVLAIIFITILAVPVIFVYLRNKLNIFLLAILYSLTWGGYAILRSIELASRNRKAAAIHQGALPWLQIILSCLAMNFFGSYPEIVMLGYSIGTFLIFISQINCIRQIARSLQVADDKEANEISTIQRGLVILALPFASWAALGSLQVSSGRWALESFYDEKEVAFFSVIYQFGYQSMVLIGYLFIQFATPIIYSRAGDATDSKRLYEAKRLVMILFFSLLFFSIGCLLVAEIFQNWILRIIAPQEYWHTAYLLAPTMLASILFNLSEIVGILPLLHSDSKSLMIPKIGSAVFGCGIMFCLVWIYGLSGAVAGTVIYAAGYFVWVTIVIFRNNYLSLRQLLVLKV